MEELLRHLVGKNIDLTAGAGFAVRGEVIEVRSGVAYVRDEEERTFYISIEKITAVAECSSHSSRPGFIA